MLNRGIDSSTAVSLDLNGGLGVAGIDSGQSHSGLASSIVNLTSNSDILQARVQEGSLEFRELLVGSDTYESLGKSVSNSNINVNGLNIELGETELSNSSSGEGSIASVEGGNSSTEVDTIELTSEGGELVLVGEGNVSLVRVVTLELQGKTREGVLKGGLDGMLTRGINFELLQSESRLVSPLQSQLAREGVGLAINVRGGGKGLQKMTVINKRMH